MQMIPRFLLTCLLLSSLLTLGAVVCADDKQQLQSIRQSIAEQEKKLAEQKQQRVALTAELQKQEVSIANLLGAIQKSDNQLSTINNNINLLTKQISSLEKKQALQRVLLARQLENAFRLGKTSSLDLVFNSQASERNERLIVYYSYINQERETQINQLRATQQELSQSKTEFEANQVAKQALLNQQKDQQSNLQSNQQQRQKTLSALDVSMQENQQKLAELKENESKLQAKLAEAERINRQIAEREARQAAQIEARQQSQNYQPSADERSLMARVSGIGKPVNGLNWPVNGTILHRFGSPLQGELRWKGLVISANEGTEVKAIAGGRVILASWLQGYGFIVALDHGRGDMSLYGYNQRVLVNVGDNIKAGQSVGLVGSSGGQGRPALYFEIRRDGKALDPSAWLKRNG